MITLLLLALATAGDASLKAEQFQFLTYDCSNPTKLRSVSPPELKDCEVEAEGKSEEAKTYTLLQKADYMRVKTKMCQVTRTRLGYYCGTYGHQTFVPQITHIQEPVKITAQQCMEMHTTGKFKVDGASYPVTLDTPTTLNLERVGKTYYTHSDVTCEGGTWYDKGIPRPGINVYESYNILIQEPEVMVDGEDKVVVAQTQRELPCPFGKEKCEFTGGRTYLWTYTTGSARCPYYKVRTVTGKEVLGADGNVVFMSTDGSMTRTVKKAPKTACDQPVFTTNYHKLFLTEALGDDNFNRPLHLAEMSVTTYSNNKDDFLYGKLTDYVKQEFAAVLREDCRQRQASRTTDFPGIAAEQAAVSDGETAAMGQGWFVTAAGEGWYQYQCQHILVTARETKECWAGLPVTLTDHDKNRYLAQRYEAGYDADIVSNKTEFFIEPHTRRLTTVGVPMPCVDYFAPVYRDSKGRWIKVCPQIQLVDAPEELQKDNYRPKNSHPEEFNFEEGGIYEAAAVRAMDKFSQAPRRQKELNSALVIMKTGNGEARRYSPHDVFPQIPDVDFDLWGGFWEWVDRWGRALSLFLLIITIFKIITTIMGFLFRCHTARRHRSGMMALILACFPSALHNVLDRVIDLRWLQGDSDVREMSNITPQAPQAADEERDKPERKSLIARRTVHPHALARRQLARMPTPRGVTIPPAPRRELPPIPLPAPDDNNNGIPANAHHYSVIPGNEE